MKRKKAILLGVVVVGLAVTAAALLLRPQAGVMSESEFLALDGLARAKYVRSLVVKAVECGDEKEAQEYLELAARLAKQVPPEHIDLLFLKFKPGRYNLDHLRPSKVIFSEKVTVFSPRARLVEKMRVEEMPFAGMADNDKAFLAPFPTRSSEHLAGQRLEIDGKAVLSIAEDDGGWKDFHLSPDHARVALADWLKSEPIEVLELATQKRLAVTPPKDFPGHYNVYPFHFDKWAADSRSFTVYVFGSETKAREMTSYRETWSVDAPTGNSSFVKRDERPYAPNIQWDAPPASRTVTPSPSHTP